MQDSISKTIEITDAKANTFKHFGLVVAALCISIRPWNIQCVEYLLRPVQQTESNHTVICSLLGNEGRA